MIIGLNIRKLLLNEENIFVKLIEFINIVWILLKYGGVIY